MIHTDLYNSLRLLRPDLPDVQTGQQAWDAVKPEGGDFPRWSFWGILQSKLPFCTNSPAKQAKIAEYINNKADRTKQLGQQWPPAVLQYGRPVRLPLPNVIKPI